MSGAPKSRSAVPRTPAGARRVGSLDEPGSPPKGPLFALVAFTLLLGVGTIGFPEYVPLNVVVIPLILSSLFLSPRYVPGFLAFLGRRDRRLAPADGPRRSATWVTVVVILGCASSCCSPPTAGPGSASPARRASRCWSTSATASSARAGCPTARPVGRRVGAPLGRRHAVRGRLLRRSATEGRLDVGGGRRLRQGRRAGTRALLLAGAIGGLVTAVPPDEFLAATNAYLLGHRWDEGFATAVQLAST